jgi:propionate CoA-transferase
MLDMVTLTVESGGIGGFPVSGEAFGAMIGAASVYDMANQFDLYDNGGLDVCFMGALEVDKEGNINAHRGPGAFAGIGGFANITAKTPTVVFCLSFNAKGLEVTQKKGVVTIEKEGSVPKRLRYIRFPYLYLTGDGHPDSPSLSILPALPFPDEESRHREQL